MINGSHLVKEARKRAGLTQVQLAERAHTTQSAIARIESGRTAPSLERLSELAETCGFDVQVALVPHDDHEVSMARERLDLLPAERLRQMLKFGRFSAKLRAAGQQAAS